MIDAHVKPVHQGHTHWVFNVIENQETSIPSYLQVNSQKMTPTEQLTPFMPIA